MSRAYQDQVIDDEEEESCPLCIEEFDPSDKGFYPCPCGFQICQFCHNKIKTTGNGLCPACRRQYDDQNIRIEAPNPEEISRFRAKQAKRKTAPKQKETSTREADSLGRKHLAGIRVRRQNLVYVTGLRLNTSDPTLSEKLRGDQFFGQYGKIDKIVVNKPKDSRSMQPVGVYITYFEKEPAALCIAMINGTENAGATIRADYGTTKYCSAYLRGDTCTNRNCTFLHEPGEENESFTREDLSMLNARSIEDGTSANPASHTRTQTSTLQTLTPIVTAAAHYMERQDSGEGTSSPVGSSDGSALPQTVSWANKAIISRPASQAASLVPSSPVVSAPIPSIAALEPTPEKINLVLPATAVPLPTPLQAEVKPTSDAEAISSGRRPVRSVSPGSKAIRHCLTSDNLKFVFDESIFASDVDGRSLTFLRTFPALFDSQGGAKRQLMKKRQMERERLESEQQIASLSGLHGREPLTGGSLQLGGEAEGPQDCNIGSDQITRPLFQNTVSSRGHTFTQPPGLGARLPRSQLYPPQDAELSTQDITNQHPQGIFSQAGPVIAPGHTRQTSRFSFANDSSTASTSVKPVGNPKLMSQQSSMMPNQLPSQFPGISQPQQSSQFYTGAVQGPPPGLKATGTPPVSGGGMFGQGHGFTSTGLGFGFNQNGRTSNDEMIRELLRGRGGSPTSGRASESGRHDTTDSTILASRNHQGIGASHSGYGAPGHSQGQGGFNSVMHNNTIQGRW